MATAPNRERLTPEQYLALERQLEGRHEFYRGEMFAMARASRNHIRIVGNLHAALHGHLRGQPCEVYMLDMRVLVKPTGLFTYPDITITRGQPRFLDNAFDTLLNPTVIIEVLSPSTELYDRVRKFAHYREIASLREYVLVAQDRMSVEWYRLEGEHWVLRDATRPEGRLVLDSIGCAIPLSQIYERVEFPPEPPPPPVFPPGPPPA